MEQFSVQSFEEVPEFTREGLETLEGRELVLFTSKGGRLDFFGFRYTVLLIQKCV